MRTTGWSNNDLSDYYAIKTTMVGGRLMTTDGKVTHPVEDVWESFQTIVENTPFVFNPPLLR